MIPKTITITHLGAKTCVTGYCHLVQARHDHSASIAILVDCSIRPGPDPGTDL
jgi:metallo-beta-lactamase family protein